MRATLWHREPSSRIVIQAAQNGFAAWGVLELQARLEFLKYAGIDFAGFAHAQFNTTSEEKTETLTLRGFNLDGSDLVQTFKIAPISLGVEAAGKFVFHVPTFNAADPFGGIELFRASAAASLEISPEGLNMFLKGDLGTRPSGRACL